MFLRKSHTDIWRKSQSAHILKRHRDQAATACLPGESLLDAAVHCSETTEACEALASWLKMSFWRVNWKNNIMVGRWLIMIFDIDLICNIQVKFILTINSWYI